MTPEKAKAVLKKHGLFYFHLRKAAFGTNLGKAFSTVYTSVVYSCFKRKIISQKSQLETTHYSPVNKCLYRNEATCSNGWDTQRACITFDLKAGVMKMYVTLRLVMMLKCWKFC